MKWVCVVDNRRYCKGTPEWDKEPAEMKDSEGTTKLFSGGTCKLTPETCGKCQSMKEQIDPAKLERISKPSYTRTVIPITPVEKAKIKSNSKTVKKLEQEMAQGKMF